MSYYDDARTVQRAAYWTLPRVLLFVIVLLLGIGVIGFLATGADLASYQFWAPKRENAKREVFRNTQSYVDGKAEYLSSLEFEYESATGDKKEALRRLILSESRTIDPAKLPADLQSFINSIR
jgi:hypothetical protein